MTVDTCGDDRFELIEEAKRRLLESTNIEDRPEEVAVLDSILFRFWQMGWLDQLREDEGARTCHFKVVIDQDPSRRGRGNICECDKCGYRCARGFIEDERFKHCPNCGKRIKEEAE